MKVIYLPHPVSAAEKAKHRAAGYKILDAKFAPAEEKLVEPEAVEPAPAPEVIAKPVIEVRNEIQMERIDNRRRGRPRKAQ